MATNTVYENKVIEAKSKNLLKTAVNTRNLMTIDNELTQTAGMEKVINVYTYDGKAEEVAVGQGNSHRGSISYKPTSYKVKTVQQVFDYFDEDFQKDDTIVDNMLKGASQVMRNKMNDDFLAEAKKASLKVEYNTAADIKYGLFVDAIAKLNVEDESSLFFVIPNAWKANIRKDADFVAARMGEIVFNGQIGTIGGVPVVATTALTDEGYVMNKEAVKLFMKKDVEVEQDRAKEIRKNTVILRTNYLVALVDDTKICKIAKHSA